MSWISEGAGAHDVGLILKVVAVVAVVAAAIGFAVAKFI
jgi:hypothetical protein